MIIINISLIRFKCTFYNTNIMYIVAICAFNFDVDIICFWIFNEAENNTFLSLNPWNGLLCLLPYQLNMILIHNTKKKKCTAHTTDDIEDLKSYRSKR